MASGCVNCGTLHDRRTDCPGTITAMGPERRSASVRVRTERGIETVRVLIAPTPGGWRARIASDPNVLWTVPGGRSTLKFWGGSPQEVEEQAIEFIEEHCARRWSRGSAGAAAPETGQSASLGRPLRSAALAKRKPARLPARYGVARPSELGATANLSEEGMFITSRCPLNAGTPIRVHVEIRGASVQVSGLVMWSRRRPEPGRPAGMGVRLLCPPPAYCSFVESLP
jgi:hypothetical protein